MPLSRAYVRPRTEIPPPARYGWHAVRQWCHRRESSVLVAAGYGPCNCGRQGGVTQVLIVDSQEPTREALCRALDGTDDIKVLAVTRDYEASVRAICRHEIDIILIDLAGIADPIGAIADFKQIRPGIRALVLAGTQEAADALQALGAGVDGYITTEDDSDTLLTAIRCVASGERYVCPMVGWHLAMNLLHAFPGAVLH